MANVNAIAHDSGCTDDARGELVCRRLDPVSLAQCLHNLTARPPEHKAILVLPMAHTNSVNVRKILGEKDHERHLCTKSYRWKYMRVQEVHEHTYVLSFETCMNIVLAMNTANIHY